MIFQTPPPKKKQKTTFEALYILRGNKLNGLVSKITNSTIKFQKAT